MTYQKGKYTKNLTIFSKGSKATLEKLDIDDLSTLTTNVPSYLLFGWIKAFEVPRSVGMK